MRSSCSSPTWASMWLSAPLVAAAAGCISPTLDAEPVLKGPDPIALQSGQLSISWDPAPGTVSEYVVGRRFVPDQFREDRRLPAYQRSTTIVLGADSPELTVLEIRVTAEP